MNGNIKNNNNNTAEESGINSNISSTLTSSLSEEEEVNHNNNSSNNSNNETRTSVVNFEGQSGFGEETPLLRPSNSVLSSTRSDVASSTRSTNSSEGFFGFSSHWLNTANLERKETFRSERDRAVDRGIVQAAFLIRDAVLGEAENPSQGTYDPYLHPENSVRNFLSLVFRQILSYRTLRQTVFFTSWILTLLTFIEPPRWCRDGYNNDETMTCEILFQLSGPPATTTANATTVTDENDEIVEYYPSAGALLITKQQSKYIEIVGITFISIVFFIRIGRDGCSLFRYLRKGPAQLIRILQIIAVVLIYFGLWSDNVVLQPFARLLLLGTFIRTLYQEVSTTLEVLPQVLNICMMLLVYMIFWAFLGTVLFYDTAEGSESFSSIVESLWTLWICVTTANYPDVMMPSYNQNRFAALYFVIFMIITFFFFMNLILASIVNTYDDAIDARKQRRKREEDAKLTAAFELMDTEKVGRIDRATIMTLFRILNKDFPEFRHISSRDAKLFYAVLDRDGSSVINIDEFLDFGSILLLEFFQEEEFSTLVQRKFPKIYKSSGYQKFLKFVKSSNFDLGIDIILVLNAVVVIIQSWPLLIGDPITLDESYMDGTIDTVWELIEAIFTGIYCLEAILKIIALGWRSYIERARNVFDFVVTILALSATVYVYYPNKFSDSRLIRYIVMARVLRLARIIVSMRPFRVVGEIGYEILPYATSVMCLLFFIMYFFAALGVELYGGMVSRDPSNPISYLILDTDFSENHYWANNFNDLISAFNVLFNLLVVNNWTECEVGFEAVSGRKLVRYYFFFFHFAGVVLVNNLVISFFISSFFSQKKILEKRKEELTVDGEAVIHGREATFDASTVTGTRTSLSGAYIARIRTNSAEEDEQDRLKRLFTQTSNMSDIRYKENEQHDYVMPFARS